MNLSKNDIAAITEKILRDKGVDFRHYKKSFLTRRIGRRLQFNQHNRIEDYLKKLDTAPDEYKILLHDLLIQVSEFFRDPEVFDYLDKNITPYIMENAAKEGDKTIRIWCCGCAYGEEAYTLAILFKEYISKHSEKNKILIYGTDISDDALQIARKNFFSANQLVNVSPYLLEKYFRPAKGGFKVIPAIKELVKLGHHDLVLDPPLGQITLLLCRNICIYWDRTLQDQIYQKLAKASETGGYLVLGKAESLTENIRPLFRTVHSRLKIYQKI